MSAPNNPPLTDESPFPYGIHVGQPMKTVPVIYFHYLWQSHGLKHEEFNLVSDYIRAKLPEWRQSHAGYHWE